MDEIWGIYERGEVMIDPEIKREFTVLNEKLDTWIAHLEEKCMLLRKPIEEHVKDGPHFRDKLVKIGESLKINWSLTLLLVGGAVGGFFYLLRGK